MKSPPAFRTCVCRSRTSATLQTRRLRLWLSLAFTAAYALISPLSSLAQSFITSDFVLHAPDPTLDRRGPCVEADTLGNFYVTWVEGVGGSTNTTARIPVTRVRYDGTVESGFAVITADSAAGFDQPKMNVLPSGEMIAVEYPQYMNYALPIEALKAPATPPYYYSFLRLIDSTGEWHGPAARVDSLMPGYKAYAMGVAVYEHGMTALCRGDSILDGYYYTQSLELNGTYLGGSVRVDSCESMTCKYGQSKRMDSYHGGFVVTWDELVYELGSGEQRPVFRIFDSLGSPVSPVIAGAYEPGYVADCGGSSPGYQSGYFPDVAVADNGEFMLIWSSCDGLYLDSLGPAKPWGQIYYADGTPKTGLILLSELAPHAALDCRVAWGDDGNYYTLWTDSRDACPTCQWPLDLYIQKVSSDGDLLGSNYIVNDVLGSVPSGYPTDIAVSRGRACIVWKDYRDYPSPMPDGEEYAQVVSLDLIGQYVHGDVNLDYRFTSADIIYLVNYVFKSGQRPMPGIMDGDVNGDCVTTAADIIYYVNFVFKGGKDFMEPCGV